MKTVIFENEPGALSIVGFSLSIAVLTVAPVLSMERIKKDVVNTNVWPYR
jgi:hypothetical protein